MNFSAVNTTEVNGSVEVWSWYGAADIALQAGGTLATGAVLGGQANVVMTAVGEGRLFSIPSFLESTVVTTASGEIKLGLVIGGDAQVQISSAADGTRWAMGESASDIVIDAAGDAQVVGPAAANFDIVVSTSLQEWITPAIPGESLAIVRLLADFEDRLAPPHFLEGEMLVELASIATPWLKVWSPPGAAGLALRASGDSRLGERIQLAGIESAIQLRAVGDIGTRHYVYAEGQCTIRLSAASLAAGRPPLPTTYVPAPRARTIIVQRGGRDIIVAREKRSV